MADALLDLEVALWLPEGEMRSRWIEFMNHPEWADCRIEREALRALGETRRALHMVDNCCMDEVTRRVVRSIRQNLG
jgi:hypothetical protein